MSLLSDEWLRHMAASGVARSGVSPEAVLSIVTELLILRAAIAPNRERVRQVVRDAVVDILRGPLRGAVTRAADAIADRCAEQLATPAVRLSAEDREILATLRSDACRPEHDDDCETCRRHRDTIALLDILDRLLGDKP